MAASRQFLFKQLQSGQTGSQSRGQLGMLSKKQFRLDCVAYFDVGQIAVEHADEKLVGSGVTSRAADQPQAVSSPFPIMPPSCSKARIHSIRTAPADRPIRAAISSNGFPCK